MRKIIIFALILSAGWLLVSSGVNTGNWVALVGGGILILLSFRVIR